MGDLAQCPAEIQAFVRQFDNVEIIRPKMRFDEVIKKSGYPMISKEISKCVSEIKNAVSEKRYCLSAMRFGISKDEYGGLNDSGKYDYAKTCSNSMFMHFKYRPLVDVNFKMSANCCNVMKKCLQKTTKRKRAKRL